MLDGLPLAAIWPPIAWLVPVVVSIAIAGAAAWLWDRVLAVIWAMGFDRRRRLAFTVPPVRALLVLGVWLTVVIPDWEGDPTSRLVVGMSLAAILTVWAYRHFRDIAGGLALSVKRAFWVGDQVATREASGRVIAIGLTQVRIRTPSGAMVDVPASELSSHTVKVAMHPRGALPVEVEVGLAEGPDPDLLLGALRDHALLSPYSDSTAPVIVELIGERRARITATPVHPDDADELRSDLTGRAAHLRSVGRG